MDPATLKVVLQLAQVLGKSRLARSLVVGLVLAGVLGAGVTAFGSWTLATQLAASLSSQQQNCGAAPQPDAIVVAGGSSTATNGETAVWQALRASGFDAVHAAGAMGNMQAESGFDAQIVQGGGHSRRPAAAGSAGYGLVQWTPGHKLSDYIGAAAPTVANEVETLKAQLAGRGPHPEKAAGDAFWATSDVAAAARVFHLRYERSASTDSSARVRNALAIYQRLQGTAVDSGSTNSEAADTIDVAPSTCMPALRVGTWNSYYGTKHPGSSGPSGPERIRRAMAKLGPQVDLVGGQEFSERSHKDAALAGLGSDFGVVGDQTSHPIWYRKSVLTLVNTDPAAQAELVFKRSDDYEGPSQGDRYVVHGEFRTISGQVVTLVNLHQLPKIQKGGGLNKAWPKRIALAVKLWTKAMKTAVAARAKGAVLVTGDMNFDGDPRGLYRAAGLTQASSVFGKLQQATRTRDIDQILYSAGVPTSEKVLGPFGSDHSARVVAFPGDTPVSPASPVDGVTPAGFNFPGQRTVEQAIAYMSDGHRVRVGSCLHEVGAAYGHQGTTRVNGHFYAVGQWTAMPARYKHTDGSTPPRGALVFWTTSNVAGHIAISAGGGYVWTTDPNGHPGTIAKVPISMPDGWGVRLGWSPPYFTGKTRTGSAA